MNKRLDQLLVKRHPLLFADRDASMKVTAMCWGFECGDGWYKLLKELCDKLERLILEQKPKDRPIFKASQVKEKYGTLCFYMSAGTDKMYDLINEAEDESAFICEQCGAPGKLRGRGWLYTACDKHKKELE